MVALKYLLAVYKVYILGSVHKYACDVDKYLRIFTFWEFHCLWVSKVSQSCINFFNVLLLDILLRDALKCLESLAQE